MDSSDVPLYRHQQRLAAAASLVAIAADARDHDHESALFP
jgi:hypothetical protein